FVSTPPLPRTTLFPYTTLFRSIRVDELRLQQQVFRRVSGQREFGKCDDVRIDIARAIHPLDDLACVSVHVTNDDIDLSHRQTQLDRKSTRLNSSHVAISYAVLC